MLSTSRGHRLLDQPLPEIGGKGTLYKRTGRCLAFRPVQAAVHSLKDLPMEIRQGLLWQPCLRRGAAQDVLVTPNKWTLSDLPDGARVGTCSLRRTAQLLARRPDLTVLPLRGNVDLRVRKVLNGEFDAIVLAQAGLTRLGLQAHISEVFPLDVMLPAPGQAALAVQCRADDTETIDLLAAIHDPITAAAVEAERAFLSALGGGCSLPVAAFAQKNNGNIILTGAVISIDGKQAIRLSAVDQEPQRLGHRLADLVLERGCGRIAKGKRMNFPIYALSA